jgi:SnoaL-like domain
MPPIASRSASLSRRTRIVPIVATQRVRCHSSLQTPIVVVYMNAKDPTPSQEFRSREALVPVFAERNKYEAIPHFVGQSTIFTLTDVRGTAETYCLAHHLTVNDDKRRMMIASLRYLDTLVEIDGVWLFAERLLYVDWIDERALT